MTSSIVFRTILGAALALAALYCEAQTASRQAASTAAASAYPSRPIRLIIPFDGVRNPWPRSSYPDIQGYSSSITATASASGGCSISRCRRAEI